MKTKTNIEYRMEWCGKTTIPAGTTVVPATNLPEPNQYWCEEWPGMNEIEEGWMRGYGFLVQESEVTS